MPKTSKTPKIMPKIMQNKTTSKIPKTPKEKQQWIRARQITAKQSGSMSEKQPWGEVNKIYQNEKKAGKVAKKSDVTKAKKSKAVSKYKMTK